MYRLFSLILAGPDKVRLSTCDLRIRGKGMLKLLKTWAFPPLALSERAPFFTSTNLDSLLISLDCPSR